MSCYSDSLVATGLYREAMVLTCPFRVTLPYTYMSSPHYSNHHLFDTKKLPKLPTGPALTFFTPVSSHVNFLVKHLQVNLVIPRSVHPFPTEFDSLQPTNILHTYLTYTHYCLLPSLEEKPLSLWLIIRSPHLDWTWQTLIQYVLNMQKKMEVFITKNVNFYELIWYYIILLSDFYMHIKPWMCIHIYTHNVKKNILLFC